MSAIFKEITTQAELDAAVNCLWDAYYDPYIPFMQVLFPIFANTAEGYENAVAESKSRLWEHHVSDPTSHWVAVADRDTGVVFAAAHWNLHKVSPFINGEPKLVADWHPEGEGREFANHVLNQVYGGRGQRLWRPHAQLDLMFTHPNHRHKGYGSQLMQWGMDKAEEMAVEVVVEASAQGVHLYKKFGLRTIEKICIDTVIDNPSNLWKKLESDTGDLFMWWMWKPHGGIYEAGITELPWIAKP